MSHRATIVQVVVVGAGPAWLRRGSLVARGLDVTVVEARDRVGGRTEGATWRTAARWSRMEGAVRNGESVAAQVAAGSPWHVVMCAVRGNG